MKYRHILDSKKRTGSLTAFKFIFRMLFLVCLTSGLSSCAILSVKTDPNINQGVKTHPTAQPEMGWQRAAFKIRWPEKSEPLWHMDLLIAHRIIGPVIEAHQNQIALWRFHRRAGNDAAGHQFSFIFYTTRETAAEIKAEIESNTLLSSLKAAGKIENLFLQNTDQTWQSAIEATSDPNWSLPLQKAWPYYIMGCSQMWLALIGQYAQDSDLSDVADAKDLDDSYREVNAKMIGTWQNEGRHALLHHLNALFGYHPIFFKLHF